MQELENGLFPSTFTVESLLMLAVATKNKKTHQDKRIVYN